MWHEGQTLNKHAQHTPYTVPTAGREPRRSHAPAAGTQNKTTPNAGLTDPGKRSICMRTEPCPCPEPGRATAAKVPRRQWQAPPFSLSAQGRDLSVAKDPRPKGAVRVKPPLKLATEVLDKLVNRKTERRSRLGAGAAVCHIRQQTGSLCFRWEPPGDGCSSGNHPECMMACSSAQASSSPEVL